tara:strand:+ start:468 stop:1067 length:600 start_codon:yes stop_codon:yes gene_type:complete
MEEITTQLNSISTILINLDEAVERLEKSKKLLESIGQPFQRFSGVKHEKGIIGCGMSHLALLSNIKPNCLILEDDIGLTEHFKPSLRIPKNTDAIYLGVSDHGFVKISPHGHRGAVLASRHCNDYKKVYNMCSTHAILYLSERYIKACAQVIHSCLESNTAFDVGLASIHRHFNILTPNDPYFYQTEQPQYTKQSVPLF